MQSSEVSHQRPCRALAVAPWGSGTVAAVAVVPDTCSASGRLKGEPSEVIFRPTAAHAVIALQDTPSSCAYAAPVSGEAIRLQLWPFHAANNGTTWLSELRV